MADDPEQIVAEETASVGTAATLIVLVKTAEVPKPLVADREME